MSRGTATPGVRKARLSRSSILMGSLLYTRAPNPITNSPMKNARASPCIGTMELKFLGRDISSVSFTSAWTNTVPVSSTALLWPNCVAAIRRVWNSGVAFSTSSATLSSLGWLVSGVAICREKIMESTITSMTRKRIRVSLPRSMCQSTYIPRASNTTPARTIQATPVPSAT